MQRSFVEVWVGNFWHRGVRLVDSGSESIRSQLIRHHQKGHLPSCNAMRKTKLSICKYLFYMQCLRVGMVSVEFLRSLHGVFLPSLNALIWAAGIVGAQAAYLLSQPYPTSLP